METVLVESTSKNTSIFGNCGISFDDYVITTLNILIPHIDHDHLKNIMENGQKTFVYPSKKWKEGININVISHNGRIFKTSRGFISCLIFSKNIYETSKYIFRDWSFDTENNHNFELLSWFVILKLNDSFEKKHFLSLLNFHWCENEEKKLKKGTPLTCISAPFGNRKFLNHYSEGIISNILGKNNDCLIFSDLSATPGSEGSPVYFHKKQQEEFPIGMVISTINWWKKQWINFTIIADLRLLISEVLDSQIIPHNKISKEMETSIEISSIIDSCVFQIYCGTIWGSCILLDEKKGIFLTNSHVVDSSNNYNNVIFVKKKRFSCEVIHSNPKNHPIDVAIIKSHDFCVGNNNNNFIKAKFSSKTPQCGDVVYAAGFSIFPKDSKAKGPTLTKGVISQICSKMIKTTCAVYPGSSGGAIFDKEGFLIGIIVCNTNTLINEFDISFPKVNMSIPTSLILPYVEDYLRTDDSRYLQKISSIDADNIWNISSKL